MAVSVVQLLILVFNKPHISYLCSPFKAYLRNKFSHQFVSFYWIKPLELQWAKWRWRIMRVISRSAASSSSDYGGRLTSDSTVVRPSGLLYFNPHHFFRNPCTHPLIDHFRSWVPIEFFGFCIHILWNWLTSLGYSREKISGKEFTVYQNLIVPEFTRMIAYCIICSNCQISKYCYTNGLVTILLLNVENKLFTLSL